MEKTYIGSVSPTSESSFRSLASRWDENFREGEKGILSLRFSSSFWRVIAESSELPSYWTGLQNPTESEIAAAKEQHAKYINGYLVARGYKLWRNCDVIGDDINVYFTAAALPMIIVIAIVAGCAAVVAAFAWGMVDKITCYKLKYEELQQYEQQNSEWTAKAFDLIDELPPEEKLDALERIYETQTSHSPLASSANLDKLALEQSETSKRVLYVSLAAGLALVVFALLRR